LAFTLLHLISTYNFIFEQTCQVSIVYNLISKLVSLHSKKNSMNYRWRLKPTDLSKTNDLQKALGVNPTICKMLVQRGYDTFEKAKGFFRMNLEQLHNPFQMLGMEKAVERIQNAIENNEKIIIYGDYDVDGTTSVSLVYAFLSTFYTNIEYYIPDRHKEGYGISLLGIDYAEKVNAPLIIALDCGTKALKQIDYANEKNIDFIICDHHTPGEVLPAAFAILNPKQNDCIYPYKELSGCGIGFKLCQAYTEKYNLSLENLYNLLDYVVISIACDIVPVTGENRILAKFGIEKLNHNPNVGVKQIVDILNYDKKLSVSDVVFKIGPRINAAGRVSHAKEAVAVLLGKDASDILQTKNEERQELDKNTTIEALAMLELPEYQSKVSTVVYNPEWHKGVIGIVASRLIENHYKPTIVFTKSNGLLVASARSVKDFNVYDAINACSEYLINFGGHFYAAGLTIKEEDFNAFSEKFESIVQGTIKEEQKIPLIEIDTELPFNEMNMSFMNLLNQFAPFGPQNMKPVFLTKNVVNAGWSKKVGKEDAHLKVHLKDELGVQANGIAFNMGDKMDLINEGAIDICYTIEENEWNGKVNLQMMVKDIRKAE
jgi:single-stranded-DNA-specific exonuclease